MGLVMNMRKSIGIRIRNYRNAMGFTQQELAERLGVTNSAVSNWEKGSNGIDIELIPKICNVLNVGISDLLDTPEVKAQSQEALEFSVTFDLLDQAGKELVRSALDFAVKYHSITQID